MVLCRLKKLGVWEKRGRVFIFNLLTAGQTLGKMVSGDPSYLSKASESTL